MWAEMGMGMRRHGMRVRINGMGTRIYEPC